MKEKIFKAICVIIFIIFIISIIVIRIYGRNMIIDERIDKKLYEYGLIEK